MWWESSAARLRNLCRYEKRRNKRPKIKVQYIQFGNKSIPRKESGRLRRNGRNTGRPDERLATIFWVALGCCAFAAIVYLLIPR